MLTVLNVNSHVNYFSLLTSITLTNHSPLAPLIPDFFDGLIGTSQIVLHLLYTVTAAVIIPRNNTLVESLMVHMLLSLWSSI